ncbi:MAG: hypothetical protein ACHQAY_19585 [Hyphomicrobiales bacterium]
MTSQAIPVDYDPFADPSGEDLALNDYVYRMAQENSAQQVMTHPDPIPPVFDDTKPFGGATTLLGRLGWYLSQKADGLGQSAEAAFTAPGRAWRGEIAPENLQAEAMNMAGWFGPGGLGRAALARPAESVLGMAGGKVASMADAVALERAQGPDTSSTPTMTTYHGSPSDFDASQAVPVDYDPFSGGNSFGLSPGARATDQEAAAGKLALTSNALPLGDLEHGDGNDVHSLAQISPRLYLGPKTLLGFEEDYKPSSWPEGPPVDAQGRLLQDMDGRPLAGKVVVGRTHVGGASQALPATQLDPVTESLLGKPAAVMALGETQHAGSGGPRVILGVTNIDSRSGHPLSIGISSELTPQGAERVHAHELGHVLDQWTDQRLSDQNLEYELRYVYNTLNNPYPEYRQRQAWNGPNRKLPENIVSPETRGYVPEAVARELAAEAFRAYLSNPDYIKLFAPKTAALIRETVNSRPILNRIIQFNSLWPLAAVGAGAAGYSLMSEGDPSARQ